MSGPGNQCLCLLLLVLCTIAVPVLGGAINRRQADDEATSTPTPAADDSDSKDTPGDCKTVQYPCTRVYSVQKPVKQCISYLCVTSVRRVYMVNKEICTRVMCKEDEVIQDENCRLLAGLPPRPFPKADAPEDTPTNEPQGS